MSIRSLPLIVLGFLGTLPLVSTDVSAPSTTAGECHGGRADPESAKTCGTCHKAIFSEWDGRKHSQAWTDEIYQAAIKKKKRAKSCYSCHIPDRVLNRVGKKPKTRQKTKKHLYHEGVTCVSCHEKDGAIHGPFGAKTDAHKSVKDPLFSEANSSGLCASCHSTKIDVVLPVGRDFKKAKLAAKGKSCVGCHMPEVTRHLSVDPTTGKPVGEKRKGRSHELLGPNDAEFCAKAFKLSAARKDGQMILTITNEAGHRVPGLRTREFHFLVRQMDKAGKTLSDNTIIVSSENGLMVEEVREFPLGLAKGAASVEVAIEHHFMKKLVAKIKTLKLPL
jgi:Cytochrome c554 and c-prime